MPDRKAFEEAKRKIIGTQRQYSGIGTLGEKTLHAILKNYYEPDQDNHEVFVGSYVADICRKGEIIEIQTRDLGRMRGKLTAFLPLHPVTIVYPIPGQKWIIGIDAESGELRKKRKSPLKGSPYAVFPELYRIKSFLKDPNLRIRPLLLDMEEYRLLNGKGRRKGSVRYDRIPTELVQEVEIDCPADYLQFVPLELSGPFTSKEFAEAAHIRIPLAQVTLNILHHMEAVRRVGKKGNMYLYEAAEEI